MVKISLLLIIPFLISSGLARASDADMDFRVEFAKNEVYAGEQTLCNFVIYTPDEVLDVEVAKFPEFRGFWKENLALRQGPITGMHVPGSKLFKVVVGTYLVVPMLTRRESTIEPMKIVARNPATQRIEGSAPPVFFLSKGELPKVLELPAFVHAEDKNFFTGAVGQLSFYQGDIRVPYQRGEPAQFRFILTGQANFPELNELPITLPANMEIISKRSLTQGSGQFAAKNFEYTVNIRDEQDFTLPTFRFVYFDPNQKKYVSIETPPLHFQFVKTAEPVEASDSHNPTLELPAQNWSRYQDWERSTWFIALNLVLALIALSFLATRAYQLFQIRRERDPKFQSRRKLVAALEALRLGNQIEFLKLADEIAAETIARHLGLERAHAVGRSQLIEQAQKKGLGGLVKRAQPVFAAYQEFAFSPSHQSAAINADLVNILGELVK